MDHQEYQYLNLLKKVLENGKKHKNRTGISTYRLLCETMRFDLSKEFPLLTTKKMFWKGIVHETLWFLSGNTNIKYLKDNGVHIWDANAEAFYKRQKEQKDIQNNPFFFDENPDEIGPVYGFQWRHFNGSAPGTGGFDQIEWAINEIKTNPESRRIIVSAWNPLQIKYMCLPPCHCFFQFNVDEDKLHCTLYIRSNDLFLGSGFNIAGYALLTCLFAHVCDLKPGVLNYIANDAHIYENHLEQAKEQITRTPLPLPTLRLNEDKKNIFDFNEKDIFLENYNCLPAIKAEMAV